MISRIQALGFRSLKYASQDLGPLHVLVGPNASGKSTFFDVLGLLAAFVADGVEGVLESRADDPRDLIWSRKGEGFEVAVEALIPQQARGGAPKALRYEVRFELSGESGAELVVAHEWLSSFNPAAKGATLAPGTAIPQTVVVGSAGNFDIVSRTRDGTSQYIYEVAAPDGGRSINRFRIGRHKSALGSLPEDEENFRAATWFRRYLAESCIVLRLDDAALRRPSPDQGPLLAADGSNLPWLARRLKAQSPERFNDWVRHLQLAIPLFEDIDVQQCPDDRRLHLTLRYRGGLQVPSFSVSDGTLRLIALTSLAYALEGDATYLVEEPENGIHPRNVELVWQSLSSVYGKQVLLASHSPLLIGLCEPEQLLCFKRDEDGGATIVRGSDHPALRAWKREVDLGTFVASGILE